jgi:hypothetical protein
MQYPTPRWGCNGGLKDGPPEMRIYIIRRKRDGSRRKEAISAQIQVKANWANRDARGNRRLARIVLLRECTRWRVRNRAGAAAVSAAPPAGRDSPPGLSIGVRRVSPCVHPVHISFL